MLQLILLCKRSFYSMNISLRLRFKLDYLFSITRM
nr:MAG TPA: hypothetical protein [Caudoviricetes sp.]